MKRHNGIEWDNKGRWVDHTEANARIAELEAEVKEQAEAIKAFHDVRVIDLNELADTRGRMVLLRDERDELRAKLEAVGEEADQCLYDSHSEIVDRMCRIRRIIESLSGGNQGKEVE